MTDFDLDKLPRRMPYHLPEGSLEAIEQAFEALSEEDQAFILGLYEEDNDTMV